MESLGRVLGGWSIAPIPKYRQLTYRTSSPTDGLIRGSLPGAADTFGQSEWQPAVGFSFSSFENAINMCGFGVGGSSRHKQPIPSAKYPTGHGLFLARACSRIRSGLQLASGTRSLGIARANGGGGRDTSGGQAFGRGSCVRRTRGHRALSICNFDSNFNQRLHSSVLERSLQGAWQTERLSRLGCAWAKPYWRRDHGSVQANRFREHTDGVASQLLTLPGEE